MLEGPSSYGTSIGRSVPTQSQDGKLSLRNGGLNLDVNTNDLEEGQTPDATDVRFDYGGVTPDGAIMAFSTPAASSDLTVMAIAPFELDTATKFMMRVRPTRVDRWNGANWLELTGALAGTAADRVQTTTHSGKFIIANGIDRLKAWDGTDGNAVASLSADAPIATFITRIGTRLLAARIKVGASIFPYDVMWSADGVITDWTNALNGAGTASVFPEGSDKSAGFITGLGTVAGGAVIFKQKGLVLGTLTGIGAAPFRFTTVDFQHGTESPYSIASGSLKSGLYWLGEDYMVYHWDGQGPPTPIGIPISSVLRTGIADRRGVLGAVDAKTHEYWLGIPTDNTGVIKVAYIFSIKEWVTTGRLVWRKRVLGNGYKALGFGYVPTSSDPIVDTVSSIVDTVNIRVDDFANTQADERVLLGDTLGQVSYVDSSSSVTTGTWTSRPIGDGKTDVTAGLVALTATSVTGGQIEVSISPDGGIMWLNPRIYTITPGKGDREFFDWLDITGSRLQFRLRFLSGFITISRISYELDNRGASR